VASVDNRGRQGASTVSLRGAPRRLGERHRLVVWTGGTATPWTLPPSGEVTIGREPPVDIPIDSPAVSRRHACIRVDGARVRIEDLGSRNATRLNGELLSGEQPLSYGDVVAFGDVLAVLEEQPNGGGVASEDEVPPEGLVMEVGERTLLIADPVMLHVYTQLRRLAQSPLSVLLVGETGTGKDLAASALHAWSKRYAGPFVSINCAAVPEAIAESELFGHERGAFTGANREKVGLLESASGGTLFLDEIGDLPAPIQPKLLRVLETQRLMPVGSVRERSIDVRVVTATYRDLAEDVRAGRFRRDLYYRLSAALVQVPPLRARHREVPLLARRFLGEACAGLGRPVLKIGDDALELLVAHTWPGNVRELKNVMEYIAALVDGPLSAKDVSTALAKETSVDAAPALPASTPPHDLRAAKEDLERRSIDAALEASGGNKTRAAKMLQMPLRTLMWKVKRFGKREGD